MSKYKRIIVNGKRIYLHRHIMQEYLGRELTSDEIVHHINDDELDNRIENLQLMTKSEHITLHRKDSNHSIETKKKISEGNKGKIISEETKRKQSESAIKRYKTYDNHMLGKIGSKNPNWIKGEVCASTIYNRRHRAWKRIKEGRGILEDFMIMKNTGGFIKN